MATERLTLFDVIVDLIPGVIFLLFLIPFVSTASIQGATSSVLSAAIVLLALGYAVGRSIHAVASRAWLTTRLTKFAWKTGFWGRLGNFYGSPQLRDIHDLVADSTYDGVDFETNFVFEDRIEAVLSRYEKGEDDNGDDEQPELADSTDYEHVIIRELLDNAQTELDFSEERGEEVPRRLKWESDLEYLEHLGHSVLHGESTLYQRYTILATFYRNLWLAILLGGISHLGLYLMANIRQIPGIISSPSIASIIAGVAIPVLFILILILLSVRWLEFRYRRLRALINDMYLISNTLGEELTPDGDDA